MNLKKLKNELNSLERNDNKRKALWKPEFGKQVVRFIPNKFEPEWPFMKMYFYYDLEKYPVVSPISFGEPDPIVELAEKLKSSGSKEDWKLGVSIEPKLRTYAPILVRGEEKEGVKFYGFGKTVYEELLRLIDDPDYGDITDPKTGTDITIDYIKTDSYPETSVRPKRNTSPMTDDPAIVELVKNMPDPTEIWKAPSYQEMQEKLEAYMNGGSSDEEDSNNEDDVPQSESKEQLAATNDVDDLMDKMFD